VSELPTRALPFIVLPQTVFFPHTYLDLELAQPAQLAMFQTARRQQEPVGVFMARLRVQPGEHEAFAQPGTFGSVMELGLQEGAASRVTLHGLFRARIRRVVTRTPCLRADIFPLPEHLHLTSHERFQTVLKELLELIQRFRLADGRGSVELPRPERWRELFSLLLNSIAAVLPTKPEQKQAWLGEDDLLVRYRLVREEMLRLWRLNLLMAQVPQPDDPRLN